MAAVQFANNAASRLVGPLAPSGTSLTVTPGDGALFPTLGAGDWFMATLIRSDGAREIVKVTSRTVDAMSITRAQEGSSALSFNPNDRIEARLTAGELGDFRDGIASAQAAASGAQSTADGKVSKAGDTMTGGLTMESGAPIITFRETDQAAPAGRWRLVADGGNWYLRRSTAGEFSSENNSLWFGTDDSAHFQNDVLIGRGNLGSVYDALASKATGAALASGLAAKPDADGVSVTGFVNGNFYEPYFRKSSDNTVRRLVANTSANGIALSWSGSFLSRTIDNTATATIWDTANAPGAGTTNLDKTFYCGDGTRIGRSWVPGSGFLSITVDGTNYGISISASDERLKREIAPSEASALSKLGRIELFSFRYKEGNAFLDPSQHHDIGFIAQQLASVDPTFVAGGGETMLSPNLQPIVATLVKAVQELRSQVDALKAQVGA